MTEILPPEVPDPPIRCPKSTGEALELGQGWPHFLYGGQKKRLKKLGWNKSGSKKGWWAKLIT